MMAEILITAPPPPPKSGAHSQRYYDSARPLFQIVHGNNTTQFLMTTMPLLSDSTARGSGAEPLCSSPQVDIPVIRYQGITVSSNQPAEFFQVDHQGSVSVSGGRPPAMP